ncbi:MAG: hypothetical protein MJ138_05805 [Kiritimatiellae bacterium]|nr:hypothetical protein [Kiritimatiellia bacterium]
MKTITLLSCCAAVACAAVAETKPAAAVETADPESEAELEEQGGGFFSNFWGFGNTGVYSGYQLYGSLLNSEPTWQTYLELNYNLPFSCGYLGVGYWGNTDLTDKRRATLGKWFNEQDYNVHWGKTFWFDDDQKWGLDYRTSVVWYFYPHHRNSTFTSPGHTFKQYTTMDWNHSFALLNPYVVPFLDVVHEYHESDGNLLQFGLKRDCKVGDQLTLTPAVTFVWRNSNYGWCFPNFGKLEGQKVNSCLATLKIGLDANYKINDYCSLFAKVAYCSIIDGDLRDAAEAASGAAYGQYKDFAWGGMGLAFNF